jgi:hypothetical protein
MKRWFALDLYKFIAMIVMLFGHTLVWLSSKDDLAINKNYFFSIMPLIGIAPNMIPISMGLSLRLMLNRYWRNSRHLPLLYFAKRSLLLIGIGFLMNYLTWGNIFTWDILPFAGLSFLLIIFLLKIVDSTSLYTLGLFSFILTPMIRSFLYNDMLLYNNKIIQIFFGDPSGNNYWPIFPWISFIIFGIYLADCYLSNIDLKKALIPVGTIGLLILWIMGEKLTMTLDPLNFWGPKLMMPPTAQLIALLCSGMILFGLVLFIEPREYFKSQITMISNNITLFYVTHTILIYHLSMYLKGHFELTWLFLFSYVFLQAIFFYSFIYIKEEVLKL